MLMEVVTCHITGADDNWQMTKSTQYKLEKDQMFHLGGAGRYAIVPAKNTIETFAATPPCLEQNKENSLALGYGKLPAKSKF